MKREKDFPVLRTPKELNEEYEVIEGNTVVNGIRHG